MIEEKELINYIDIQVRTLKVVSDHSGDIPAHACIEILSLIKTKILNMRDELMPATKIPEST